MGSLFATPIYLAGLAFIAAPVVIHLLNRIFKRPFDWAAMELLERALKRTRTITRVENLLLLLLRCAFIALLCMALAEPARWSVFPGEIRADTRPTRMIVLLDNSASMTYSPDEERSVWRRAVQRVSDMASRLTPGRDQVDVFPMWPSGFARDEGGAPGGGNSFLSTNNPDDVPALLSRIHPTARHTDVAGALERVLEEGLNPPDTHFAGNRWVVIVSDMQKAGWEELLNAPSRHARLLENVREKSGGRISIVDVGATEGEANFAVEDIAVRGAAVVTNREDDVVTFNFTVRNDSPPSTPPARRTLRLWFGSELQSVERIPALAPGERAVVTVRRRFSEIGRHHVRAELDPDAMRADNERHLVVDVREGIRVLAVAESDDSGALDRELSYFTNALTVSEIGEDGRRRPLTKVVVDEIDARGLADADFSRYDVVALAGVPGRFLSARIIDALEEYVRLGGAMFMALGGRINVPADNPEKAFYNQRLYRGGQGLLPGMLLPRVAIARDSLIDPDRGWSMVYDTGARAPVVRAFAAEEKLDLLDSRAARVSAYIPVRVQESDLRDKSALPLLYLDTASQPASASEKHPVPRPPVLLEKRFGEGRVMLLATTVNPAWNNWYKAEMWVSFLGEIMNSLASGRAGPRNLRAGDEYRRILPGSRLLRQFLIIDPAGSGAKTPLVPRNLDALADGQKENKAGHGRLLIAYRGTDRLGVYTLRIRERRDDNDGESPGEGGWRATDELFAVNLDPRESDLSKVGVGPKGTEQTSPTDAIMRTYPDDFSAGEQNLRLDDANRPQGSRGWWWLLCAAFGLLFAETAVALRAGRRR